MGSRMEDTEEPSSENRVVQSCRSHIPDLRQRVPGYLGLIVFGSGATGDAGPLSDVDLLIVSSTPLTPSRFHSPHVDLNIVSLGALESLEVRLLADREQPWDGIFASILLLDCQSSELEVLCASIQAYWETFRSPAVSDIEALRFAAAKAIHYTEVATTSIERTLMISRFIGIVLLSNELISGRRWAGVRAALRRAEPELAGLLQELEEAEDPVSVLERIESVTFRDVGGAWRSGVMIVQGGFDRGDNAPLRLTDSQEAYLMELCEVM